MKIDRHNYEEFFILYWDNELTAVQKQAVENFVDQNADLSAEFEILGETRFIPDTTEQFKEKDFLLNDSFINITNYEEQLLNYIDDEVTAEERKEVEKFVGLNPDAQKELALLQKTKLQPEEEVVFVDKSVLYRREEKPVRVISMTWFRVAVAAAIILIAGFTALQLINTGKKGNDIAGDQPMVKTDPGKNTPVNAEVKTLKDESKEPNDKQVGEGIASVNDKPTKETNQSKKESIKIKEDKKKVDENAIASTTQKPENKNNLPTPRKDNLTANQNTIDGIAADIQLPDRKKVDAAQFQKSETNANDASFAKSIVTSKAGTPLDNIYTPDVVAKEKDGGGLKEFLRKTTRVFERRTKIQTTTEDNKLLVGAFAVSLK